MHQISDLLLTGIALGMPAYFVCRARRGGIVLGAAGLWVLVYLCTEVSYSLDGLPPQDTRASGVEEWGMSGWLFGLIYSCLVWLLKETFMMCHRGTLLFQEQSKLGLPPAQILLEVWRELNRHEPGAGSLTSVRGGVTSL